MSKEVAYISSISMSTWSATSEGSGSINVRHGGSHTSFDLDAEDVSLLRELAAKIVDKHKRIFAQAINEIDVTPQLTYDSAKTIDEAPSHDEYDDLF